MTELEDLVLRHYRVERRGGEMVAIQDPDGLYKAPSAQALERALNTKCRIEPTDNLFVRTRHNKGFGIWRQMSR